MPVALCPFYAHDQRLVAVGQAVFAALKANVTRMMDVRAAAARGPSLVSYFS